MKIRLLNDRVVVKRMEEERTSAGGIVIPDSATEKSAMATVLAVGEGKMLDDGTMKPLTVQIGDTVAIGEYAGQKMKLAGEEVIVLKEEDIIGIMSK
jgi:chaperonin GroES